MKIAIKNIGVSVQVFHDMNGKQRTIRPGETAAFDVLPKIGRRLIDENGKPRAKLEVEAVDVNENDSDIGGDADDTAKAGSFTLNEGQGLEPQGLQQALGKANNTGNPVLAQPEAVKPVVAPEGDVHADPVAVAARAAATPPAATAPTPEPTNIAALIGAINAGDLSQQDQVRLATQLLPKGTLPRSPKPAQIMNALRKFNK